MTEVLIDNLLDTLYSRKIILNALISGITNPYYIQNLVNKNVLSGEYFVRTLSA